MVRELLDIRGHLCHRYIPWQIVVIRVVIGNWNDWVCPEHSDEMDQRIADGYGQGYFGYKEED